MSLLDDIIDGSVDSSMTTADLLRRVVIVSTRVGADHIRLWAKLELDGYGASDELPDYRSIDTHVVGLFVGPFNRQISKTIPSYAGFEDLFVVSLRQPIAELHAFALTPGDSDPTQGWNAFEVRRYEDAKIHFIDGYYLFSAENMIPRQRLIGIIDAVRTRAMEFALALQKDAPEAGTVGGPTVESDPAMAKSIVTITNNIYGSGANVAFGERVSQTSAIAEGDIEGLTAAIEKFGLGPESSAEFVEALQADNSIDGSRVVSFVKKIREGSIAIAGSVSSDVVAGALIELGKAFLGLT